MQTIQCISGERSALKFRYKSKRGTRLYRKTNQLLEIQSRIKRDKTVSKALENDLRAAERSVRALREAKKERDHLCVNRQASQPVQELVPTLTQGELKGARRGLRDRCQGVEKIAGQRRPVRTRPRKTLHQKACREAGVVATLLERYTAGSKSRFDTLKSAPSRSKGIKPWRRVLHKLIRIKDPRGELDIAQPGAFAVHAKRFCRCPSSSRQVAEKTASLFEDYKQGAKSCKSALANCRCRRLLERLIQIYEKSYDLSSKSVHSVDGLGKSQAATYFVRLIIASSLTRALYYR